VPFVLKSGSLSLLETLGPVQACNGIALPVYLFRVQAYCAVFYFATLQFDALFCKFAYYWKN
jgi:hypothetical protein